MAVRKATDAGDDSGSGVRGRLDRDPWQLELYRLRRGRLRLVGTARPGDGTALTSGVVPLTFALVRGRPRPRVRISHTATDQQ